MPEIPSETAMSPSLLFTSEKKFGLVAWVVVFISIACLVYVYRYELTEHPLAGFIRLLLPVIAILTIHLHEQILHKHNSTKKIRILMRLLAIPILTLGINWLCVFSLTDYRSHFRLLLILHGIVFIALGLFLVHYKFDQRGKQIATERSS